MNMINYDSQNALDSLKTLRSKLLLSGEAALGLDKEFSDLEEMIGKLENGVVELAVFGEVSSGKSSLLNALLGEQAFKTGARHGVTRTVGKMQWDVERKVFRSQGNSRLILLDTPGINEVDGEKRSEIAHETIRHSDIVIFVIKSDITEVEYDAISELHKKNKPIIVAFNKIDTYNREQKDTIAFEVCKKLKGIVARQNFIMTAGDPMEREIIRENPDGSEEIIIKKPKPIVEDLKERIFDILDKEEKAIVALNSSLFAANITDRVAERRIKLKRQFADKLIMKYSLMKATVVAVNPVPLLDMAGGAGVDYIMIKGLSQLYDIELTFKGSQDLIMEILKSMGIIGAVEFITNLAAGALELVTFGLANIVTGIPQGGVAGWTSFLIGKASHEYFANGASWGEKGPKKIVEEILANTDKKSIISEIEAGVKAAIENKTIQTQE